MKTNPKAGKPTRTRALLKKTNISYLYRHEGHGGYYGIKKVGGKIKTHSLETTLRVVAENNLRDWLAKLSHLDVQGQDLTLEGLVDKFKAARASKAESTIESERIMADSLLKKMGKGVMVSKIRASDVDVWFNNATAKMRKKTVDRWRQFARQLFKMAVDDHVIAESPFIESHHPAKKKQKIIRHIPSLEEFEKIVAEIRQPNWGGVRVGKRGGQRPKFQHESADFAEFEGRAGLGQAEISALTWEDFDEKPKAAMPRGSIQVRRAKTDTYFEIPIYSGLVPVLAGMRKRANGAKLIGRLFKIAEIKHALASACARLKLPKFTQRNLRQMRIVEMIRAGINPKLVAEYQGHRDGGILVMQIYTDVFGSGDDAWKASELLKDEGKVVSMPGAVGAA